MKKILLPLLVILTLTGCHTKPELRKDIADFISKFSLKESMDAYKSGGYTYLVEDNIEGKKSVTRIEMEFSYLDANHPTYSKITTNYENDVQTSKEEVEFVEMDEKYYISTNGELKESSLDECSKLIENFFFLKTQVDGEYHTQGMYYGDYIKQIAPVVQNRITIDQENELYLYEYEVEAVQDGVIVNYTQNYSVNKIGMLVENHAIAQSVKETKKTDVYVHD